VTGIGPGNNPPTATEIRIRVGWLGNESLSNVILDKIKQHL
jgi:hypothetical protein